MTTKTKTTLEPIADQIVVKQDHVDEILASGLILPAGTKDRPTTGKVLFVGPGNWNLKRGERMPVQVQPGDSILFGPWSGREIKVDGDPVLIIKEEHVLAILT